jgi:riboflavin-specific deaminase-like protein
VSYAQTLDGRVATTTGESKWISCPDSLRFAHEMRASHDAVLVGAGTIYKDDPRLTVRHVPGTSPLRVVVDSTLRTPPNAAVLADGAARGTVFAVTDRAPEERREKAHSLGATVMKLPSSLDGRVDLAALLEELLASGIGSVMVEGGATLITGFFRTRRCAEDPGRRHRSHRRPRHPRPVPISHPCRRRSKTLRGRSYRQRTHRIPR